MYNTYIAYDGDGLTDTFAIPFSYRDEAEVSVLVDGVEVDFTFATASTVQIEAPLAIDSTLVIKRVTDITTADVEWALQTVVGSDVNIVVEQLRNAIQEAYDRYDEIVAELPTDGEDGDFINKYEGAWSSLTAYTAGQIVTHGGSCYIALATSTNITPGTDGTKWEVIALKGTDGNGAGDMTKVIYDTDDDGKVDHAELADAAPWSGITGKPSDFTPSAHTHDDRYFTESEVTTLLSGKASTAHTHDDRYYTESEVDALLAAVSNVPDRQVFDASGTWTKPTGFSANAFAVIEAWGAGGSGGKGSTKGAGGGGGGYVKKTVALSSLGSTETVTIGAGGAAVTTANTDGANGGNTTFGSVVTAYGGRGAVSGYGGGGGGPLGAGAAEVPGSPLILSNYASGDSYPVYAGSGGYSTYSAGDAVDHGGGGGGYVISTNGGKSVNGGGGGGGYSSGTGGTSINGGAGGAGANGSSGSNGSQPGGGGGGTNTGTSSGAGADGRVIVTVYEVA